MAESTEILVDLSDLAWNRLIPLALGAVVVFLAVRLWRRPPDRAELEEEGDDLPFH